MRTGDIVKNGKTGKTVKIVKIGRSGTVPKPKYGDDYYIKLAEESLKADTINILDRLNWEFERDDDDEEDESPILSIGLLLPLVDEDDEETGQRHYTYYVEFKNRKIADSWFDSLKNNSW